MSAREYWTVLREDRKLIAGVLVLCLLGAVLLDVLLPRTYTSSAVFYVASAQPESSSTDAYSGAQLSTERVKSYTELLQGPRVARDASLLLGGTPTADEIQGAITASSVTETVVLTLEVTERSPDDARLVAGAVSTAFTRLVGAIESTGGVVNRPIATAEVILPPTTPDEPSGPRTTILFAVALLVGLVLGVGVALARRALRDAVDSPDTLAERLGAPVLGVVPALRRAPKYPALLAEPPTGARGRNARRMRARAESYRRARAALRSVAEDRRCLVLTGTGPDQGTSTAAVDLAVAFAASGASVLLVDADLRSPTLADTLALDTHVGLREVLEQGVALEAAIQRWSRGSIDVLTAGATGARPSEVLIGGRLDSVLATLRERYDHVIVDTPAVTDAADAVDVARHADGVVLVCRRGSTRPDDIDAAASALGLAGVPVLGALLTWATDVRDAPGGARRTMLALPSGSSSQSEEPTPAPAPAPAPTPAPAPREPEPAAWSPSRTVRTRPEPMPADEADGDHPTARVRARGAAPEESATPKRTTAERTPAPTPAESQPGTTRPRRRATRGTITVPSPNGHRPE
ncbi:capsular exopolysaccharide synthesis family protein [Actinomycetospora succinea]|uniref:Capsular exopolysaccharide synthesis family protein n=1 Tax=Actinomycetospora succinea TaxID=663603 RepID=A0A4R6UT64_9PSEU|nr:polysaccharide biosynthesis tyrosine autokinase [Actinomycetospora succinea]TDQ48883.1 capsular exopolysaccharide synthesis family protein [Actinomycetospora succinea]